MKVLGFLSFLGGAYYGFQRQKGKQTVQGSVEATLSSLLNEDIAIKGAGRTDAGVSAVSYPFAFCLSRKVDLKRLLSYFNRRLPKDISCSSLAYVDDSFDPRHSSYLKVYRYRFSVKDKLSLDSGVEAYLGDYAFEWDVFQKALDVFLGVHDFSNFTCKKEDVDGFVRDIKSIQLSFDGKSGRGEAVFSASGFMTYQIRLMMGYALRVGMGKSSLEELKMALERKPRLVTHYKAPACGLSLLEVKYEAIPYL